MPTGLSVNDVVDVTISLTFAGAAYRNFGAVLVLGPSNVIDVVERRRIYSNTEGIASDFGTTAPEYLWAQEFFSQSPTPSRLQVGRWAQTATAGILHGASLTPAQRLLSNFTGITTGAFKVSIDGSLKSIGSLSFASATNLNGIASTIQAALVTGGATGATVTWDAVNFRFNIQSGTTGTGSSVSYATAPASGTDISVLLGLSATPTNTGSTADVPVAGIAAETLLSCVENFGNLFGDWYMLSVASGTTPADADHIAVAGYIQSAGQPRTYWITSQNTAAYDSTQTSDLGSVLDSLDYDRTEIDFSSTNAYASASIMALFATIQYSGSDTTITGKFKQQPGVIAEALSENQAAVLKSKNYNVYALYQNGVAITQEAVMANGTFIDSRINADWLANYIQTNAFNLLVSNPKIPQTDAGMSLLKANMTASLQQSVVNGYIAPGVWNAAGFGALNEGDMLPDGFYVYAPLVASQSEVDRAARKSVPFQIAAKEAGAVHSANISITVNP